MSEKKVKGSLLMDYVRMIRANKDREWDKYLKDEDWEIINSRVLPSVWYPLETFTRAGLATFHVLADGDLKKVHAWGRISMEQLVKGIYKSVISESDPMKALERFMLLRQQFFNFSVMEFEKQGDKHAKVWVDYPPEEEGGEPYAAQLEGGFERIVELTGGSNVKIEFHPGEYEGKRGIEFDVSWD